MQRVSEWPNPRAAGARCLAEAGPWGSTDGPMPRLSSKAPLWGGHASSFGGGGSGKLYTYIYIFFFFFFRVGVSL